MPTIKCGDGPGPCFTAADGADPNHPDSSRTGPLSRPGGSNRARAGRQSGGLELVFCRLWLGCHAGSRFSDRIGADRLSDAKCIDNPNINQIDWRRCPIILCGAPRKRKLASTTTLRGLDFKRWPPRGNDWYSVRLDRGVRAHLRNDRGGEAWFAEEVGSHDVMGH